MVVDEIELDGRRVAFRQAGTGPVVLLVHGLAGTMHTWNGIVAELSTRCTVVTPDLPGHGRSAAPAGDYSLGAYANGLRDLLGALGHRAATVVGHSLGGGIAMQFAFQFPERCERLVLVSSGGLGSEVHPALRAATLPGADRVIALIAHRRLIAAGNTIGRWAATIGIRPHSSLIESAPTYATLGEPDARRAFIHTLRGVVDYRGQRVSARDHLDLINHAPCLLVWGADDPVIPVEHAHAAHRDMPGSRLELFDRTGHFPHVTHPDRFAQALHAFIDATQPAETSRVDSARLLGDRSRRRSSRPFPPPQR